MVFPLPMFPAMTMCIFPGCEILICRENHEFLFHPAVNGANIVFFVQNVVLNCLKKPKTATLPSLFMLDRRNSKIIAFFLLLFTHLIVPLTVVEGTFVRKRKEKKRFFLLLFTHLIVPLIAVEGTFVR